MELHGFLVFTASGFRSGSFQRPSLFHPVFMGDQIGFQAAVHVFQVGVQIRDTPIFCSGNFDIQEDHIDLGVKNAVQAFQSYGSTAPVEVEKQTRIWKERLEIS